MEKLEAELEHLRSVRRREVMEQLKEARSLGDLSDNPRYDEVREELSKLEDRIGEIEGILKNSEISG